jgi:hypothetical protein
MCAIAALKAAALRSVAATCGAAVGAAGADVLPAFLAARAARFAAFMFAARFVSTATFAAARDAMLFRRPLALFK